MSQTTLGFLPETLRWSLFRLLEALSEQRTPGTTLSVESGPDAVAREGKWLWVYCTSIGELQALETLVRRYQTEMRLQLLLLSNHPHYTTAYLSKFPQAWFAGTGGQIAQVKTLIQRFPPVELLIGEIPCLLSEAPCRFSYAMIRGVAHAGARVSVVNGWLYHETPIARLDRLEKLWFECDYFRLIQQYFVQTNSVADALRARGVADTQLTVTGSLKFDQVHAPHGPPPHSPEWWQLLQQRDANNERPMTLVAGCLTDDAEQRLVLDAFVQLRTQHNPNARLVIAPRHPEKPERMRALHTLLAEYALPYVVRTDWQGEPLEMYTVLILNTIGELRHFYSLADQAYVGVNHNVLEPIGCGVPVTVSGDWNPQYPSYPIYLQCRDAGLIRYCADAPCLLEAWCSVTSGGGVSDLAIKDILLRLSGATNKVLARMREMQLASIRSQIAE